MTDSNKINEDNFEKFYQDFTAGRLDEKRCEELLCFMETHINWHEEEGNAVVLRHSKKDILNNNFKQSLLQVNYEIEEISSSNINAFLCAKIEGLLSDKSETKLTIYLDENPHFQNDLKWLSMTHLEADQNLKYPNKSDLKRKETKILWPIVAAAACFIGLLMFGLNRKDENLKSMVSNMADTKQNVSSNTDTLIHQKNDARFENSWTQQIKEDFRYRVSQNNTSDSIFDFYDSYANNEIDTVELFEDKLPAMPTEIVESPKEIFISALNEKEPIPIQTMNRHTLNNPIHPITAGLSYLTQQDIDFRMANDESNKKGRYFLKVGKLEILHIEN